jgi:hypothetical protein
VYRVLAFVWLFLGIGLLFGPEVYAPARDWAIMEHRYPLGGFAFMLSAYNMIRWRLIRARQLEAEREREDRQRRRDTVRKVDPTFDFSDAPPKDDDKKSAP